MKEQNPGIFSSVGLTSTNLSPVVKSALRSFSFPQHNHTAFRAYGFSYLMGKPAEEWSLSLTPSSVAVINAWIPTSISRTYNFSLLNSSGNNMFRLVYQ